MTKLNRKELRELIADRLRDKSTSDAEFVRLTRRYQELAAFPDPNNRRPCRPRKSTEPVTPSAMERPGVSGEEASIHELVLQIEAERALSKQT